MKTGEGGSPSEQEARAASYLSPSALTGEGGGPGSNASSATIGHMSGRVTSHSGLTFLIGKLGADTHVGGRVRCR